MHDGGYRPQALKYVENYHALKARAQAAEGERLNSVSEFWVKNRGAILDAIKAAGFELMSNQNGFWLNRVDAAIKGEAK